MQLASKQVTQCTTFLLLIFSVTASISSYLHLLCGQPASAIVY